MPFLFASPWLSTTPLSPALVESPLAADAAACCPVVPLAGVAVVAKIDLCRISDDLSEVLQIFNLLVVGVGDTIAKIVFHVATSCDTARLNSLNSDDAVLVYDTKADISLSAKWYRD
eukprot:CAMPEP_0195026464 /NCGR_PEP_ID=MMETSP0326_2-20130528/50332_1 /TAXON_ID=2866 ORGANISM="Crypthecodinium cohnii, Strain Seligo" /NCGR_SAMPLE_ID=MMETSP0326_2 /ASSEMBLY_ACC=CAM_ASM_000348 /LENGTH=116 /DNA_ID=CAMNT_0040048321 /DNA_START=23 /DNA_END=375 /DNA_ORIENTATION=+